MRNIYNTRDDRNVIYQHKPTLYTHYVFPVWIILSLILGLVSYFKGMLPDFRLGHPVMAWFTIIIYLLSVIYFFMVIQSIMYVIVYQLIKDNQIKTEQRLLKRPFPNQKQWKALLRSNHRKPKVALIYCTYNDFLPDCLYQCLHYQTYPVDVKILDDSSKTEYRNQVDKFSQLHSNVQVIRRIKHKNDKNKAGNLNHGLKVIKHQNYDFYVFLDSDELLEPKFVAKMLKEFYYGDVFGYHVGLIQATHHSGRNINKFMDMNALSAKYFWNTQNVVRSSESGIREPNGKHHQPMIVKKGDAVGFNLGHGCMADARALYKSGLFPNVVSEDVASTMSMIFHGYNTYFSTQIHGNEETVTSMQAMKVRSNKFQNGDLQWCRKYFKPIKNTKMDTRLQKLDTLNFIGATNISAFLYISVPLYSVWYPLMHSFIGTSLAFLIPIILFLYSSGIIDTLYSLNELNWLSVIKREFQVIATFSSTYYLCVKATFGQLLFHHKAKFNVTPKGTSHVKVSEAITNNLSEMIFSLITIFAVFLASYLSGYVWLGWMILLAFVPPLFSPISELSENHQTRHEKHMSKVFQLHQNQALKYHQVPDDNVWDDWTV